ncbi:uncharacterized protein J3D65DRAFT_419847 [Phyllosticta citribraziliensis]|uniref:Uncharacterized protein n=1 Tax=Phyllosticta citribraziliensis TaxID=989973 RepID=A0ABR1LMQ8_9PEZI
MVFGLARGGSANTSSDGPGSAANSVPSAPPFPVLGPHRRTPSYTFMNHTPRSHEVNTPRPPPAASPPPPALRRHQRAGGARAPKRRLDKHAEPRSQSETHSSPSEAAAGTVDVDEDRSATEPWWNLPDQPFWPDGHFNSSASLDLRCSPRVIILDEEEEEQLRQSTNTKSSLGDPAKSPTTADSLQRAASRAEPTSGGGSIGRHDTPTSQTATSPRVKPVLRIQTTNISPATTTTNRPITRGRRFSPSQPQTAPTFVPSNEKGPSITTSISTSTSINAGKPKKMGTVGIPRGPYARIPGIGPEHRELASFLRDTGPASGSESGSGRRSKGSTSSKSALRFLPGYHRAAGRKAGLVEKVGSLEGWPGKGTGIPGMRTGKLRGGGAGGSGIKETFVPAEGVVQKVSTTGRKYLQIVTDHLPSDGHSSMQSKSSDFALKRRSASLLDKPGHGLGTDTFDTWLSTLALQQHPDLSDSLVIPDPAQSRLRITNPSAPSMSDAQSTTNKSATLVENDQQVIKQAEKPNLRRSGSAATDVRAALFSNPPSGHPSPSVAAMNDAESEAFDTDVEIILPVPVGMEVFRSKSSESFRESDKKTRNHEDRTAERSTEETSRERLAGQGIYRPKEQDRLSISIKSDLDDEEKSRQDSFVSEGSSSPELDEGGVEATHRHSREDKTRARKLRDLQRRRHNIDEIVAQPLEEESSEGEHVDRTTNITTKITKANRDQLERARHLIGRSNTTPSSSSARLSVADGNKGTDKAKEKDSTRLRPASTCSVSNDPHPSPSYRTGYTPLTGQMALSPVVTVAEQMPVPRPKHPRKPARLVLKERRQSRPLAIAVRTSVGSTNGVYGNGSSSLALVEQGRVRKSLDDAALESRGERDATGRTRRASSLKFVPGQRDHPHHHHHGHYQSRPNSRTSTHHQHRQSNSFAVGSGDNNGGGSGVRNNRASHFTLQTPSAMSVVSRSSYPRLSHDSRSSRGSGSLLQGSTAGGATTTSSSSTTAAGSASHQSSHPSYLPHYYQRHHHHQHQSSSGHAKKAVSGNSSSGGGSGNGSKGKTTATPAPNAMAAAATSSGKSRKRNRTAALEARLEAVERQNRLLEAALQAVLAAGGALGGVGGRGSVGMIGMGDDDHDSECACGWESSSTSGSVSDVEENEAEGLMEKSKEKAQKGKVVEEVGVA